MQTASTVEGTIGGVLREALPSEGTVYLADPTAAVCESLVAVLRDLGSVPTVRVVADESVLKGVFDDFVLASTAADLVEAGTLSLRTAPESAGNALLVAEGSVTAVVPAEEAVAGLRTEDSEFLEAARATHGDRWEAGAPYDLRTPAISRVRATMDDRIGEGPRAEFDAVLESLETTRGRDDLDEVSLSLLVAAKNEVLLYDVSKWGEDVGVASKATFSRTKTRLEELGLIDTEKVPIDVGRPRLRLMLADDRLDDADPDQLASVARSMLT